MKIVRLWLPCITLLLLVACSELQSTTQVVQLTADLATATQTIKLPSCTPTPSATATPTARPTATSTATATSTPTATATTTPSATATPTPPHPLDIAFMRSQSYPGSDLIFEETLAPGSNYERYIVSYRSEGFKIYAYMTVPTGTRPTTGWPVVIFNHGYIPPTEYRSTERYVAYVDAFARRGYIVFRSDYRGHGFSEGTASGSSSAAYTIDVLNGVASVKRYTDADPGRIGMWGHSMGGSITLRAMVVTEDIKAGVIWAGMVAPYPDILSFFLRRITPTQSEESDTSARSRWAQAWLDQYGSARENSAFWAAISPNSFLADLSGPLALHHGTGDATVPLEYSLMLAEQLETAGQPVELYTYEGDDHNISGNWGLAMTRSVEFMDAHVK